MEAVRLVIGFFTIGLCTGYAAMLTVVRVSTLGSANIVMWTQ